MANEVEWLTPQSEYRPTEYMQGWMKFWFDDQKRLYVAKQFQLSRLQYLKTHWKKSRDLAAAGFDYEDLQEELLLCETKIKSTNETIRLLQSEAELTKQLYRYAANRTQYGKFVRDWRPGEDLNLRPAP